MYYGSSLKYAKAVLGFSIFLAFGAILAQSQLQSMSNNAEEEEILELLNEQQLQQTLNNKQEQELKTEEENMQTHAQEENREDIDQPQ